MPLPLPSANPSVAAPLPRATTPERPGCRDERGAATSWLERLGLGRPELRAWAFYDWANSAFLTTIVAAVFPIYYNNVAAKGLAPETAAFNFSIGHDVRWPSAR